MAKNPTKVVAAVIKEAHIPLLMQSISDVKIRPGVSSVVIDFHTAFVTVPVVEVSRVERIAQQVPNPVMAQFPIFGGLREVHRLEFRELDAMTHYQFNIKAAGGPDGGLGIAKIFGDFFTGTRSGDILFDRLQVVQREDQDMHFNIEIYDGTGTNHILSRFLSGHKFLDRGDYDQPFPNVNMRFLPDSVRISNLGYNTDVDFPSGFSGFASGKGPETLPFSKYPDGNSYVDSDGAIRIEIVQTLEFGQFPTGGDQTLPFVLSSINKRFGYSIEGRVVYRVTDHPETIRRAKIAAQIAKLTHTTATMTVGKALVAGGKKDGGKGIRAHVFALGPDDTVYHQTHDPAAKPSPWRQIGEAVSGPLTMLDSQTGRVDLFAAGKGGTLLHAPLDDPGDQKIGPVWRSLGNDVGPHVFALRDAGGAAHVFGFDRSGAVRHLDTSVYGAAGKGASAWDNLEGKFSGSLSVAAQKDVFHVFVSDGERGVFHRQWPPKGSRTHKADWLLLDGFKGPVSANVAGDGSVVAVGFEFGNAHAFKVWTAAKGWGEGGWGTLRSAGPIGKKRPKK